MTETLEGSVSAQQDNGRDRRLGTLARTFLCTPAFRGGFMSENLRQVSKSLYHISMSQSNLQGH